MRDGQYLDPDCPACQRRASGEDPHGPRHQPSDRCESGKRPHCTCDTCY